MFHEQVGKAPGKRFKDCEIGGLKHRVKEINNKEVSGCRKTCIEQVETAPKIRI